VPVGSVWKYLDNGTDQGTAWVAPAFNATNKYVTTYSRRSFGVTNTCSFTSLTVRLLRDDRGGLSQRAQTTMLRTNQSSLLVEDARVCALLGRIVSRLTVDQGLRDDMVQESQIHLWRLESNEPGHTRSWYLQSCRFHLQHWLVYGRSVDSLKRANGDKRVEINGVSETLPVEWHHTNDELIEVVSARDIVSTLAARLNARERAVLRGLADGMSVRDIAKNLELSYPTALKCRRRIAALAARLGISQPAPSTSDSTKARCASTSSVKSVGKRLGSVRILPSMPSVVLAQR
jgi:DNA-binding CsgD family transcriptional regulator